jgi:hypothetical protein
MDHKPPLSASYTRLCPDESAEEGVHIKGDVSKVCDEGKFGIWWSWDRIRLEWKHGSKRKVIAVYGSSCAVGLLVGAIIGTLSNYIAWWRNDGKCV